jgi:TRAP-type C4-dicarboxylate transport system substrate-binding protein
MIKLAPAALAAVLTVAAPLATRADEPILLRLGFPAPPQSYINTFGVTPWKADVEKAAGGLLEIKVFPGGTVANFSNAYDRVVNGVIEMTFSTMGSVAGLFVKSNVSSLPFEAKNSVEASLAQWRMYASGVTASDYEKVRPIGLFTFSSSNLHTKTPIRTMADLKGMKLAAGGRIDADSLNLLGAVPITMTPSEYYQAISRGLIEGSTLSWPGVQVFKTYEVAKNHLINVPFGLAGGYVIMNKDAYAKLPAKAKAAIDEYSGESFAKRLGIGGEKADEHILAGLKKQPDQHFTQLSDAEAARWKKKLEPIAAEWVKATPDGAHVLAAYRAEVAKASKEGF